MGYFRKLEHGKVDVVKLVAENNGNGLFLKCIPLICGPGDAFTTNGQILHGSYTNTSKDRRVTMNFVFHRYISGIGIEGKLSCAGNYCDKKYLRGSCRTM
ncbi:MAG: ectoine hydroxylase-related dioxygenase (phytanoyl-CoA dioxygenase family) [Candidatus Poriferisodalaceae bacterium]|jgi:ectoine hydroxylase-related dioxygenase (phytanoyl-CoA dioxygenase family)